MSSFPRPIEIPKRVSLSAQAATAIRKAIDEGAWTEFIPSERRLCEMFQVSRPTIRTALHLLAKQGLLEIHQGKRIRLVGRPQELGRKQNRLVGLITPEPVEQLSLTSYRSISEMRSHLAEHGFSTEILVCPPRSPRTQRRQLEDFIRRNRVFCCVLLSGSKELQQWFSEHSVPALVLGSCHPEVKLPSLDVDYRSVCRHAAGVLLGKGHRQLALLVPNSNIAGDIASEEGFKEGLAQPGHDQATGTIVRHNATAQNIAAKLDVLFNSPRAPTALLVAKPQHTFIVLIYLLKRGLTVPDTVSFIARDHDHIFDIVGPPIAHYSFGNESLAHRLSRLMLQMVDQGYLSPEPNLIFPKYCPGGTVRNLTP